MIPVLIAPYYNRFDLLVRMLRSVDERVGRLLVIDNARTEKILDVFPNGDVARVFTPPYSSLGYGGSINFGITQTADAPWWMWASNDVAFHAGHLRTVVERMEAATGPRIITGGFTWGAVNRALIQTVGLVDEWSFFPIYYDDNDFQRRCALAGVEWIEDWATGSDHLASSTIKSDARIELANHETFRENQKRYIAKWGGGPREERFAYPYNDPNHPLNHLVPDIEGRASRQW